MGKRLLPAAAAVSIALTAPAHAGGYVMPVIEMAVPTPAPVAAQGPMICGQRPEICAIALLALLALLASKGGDDHRDWSSATPPMPPRPPIPKPCVWNCPEKPPVVIPPLPPTPAPVPLPGALMAMGAGLGALGGIGWLRRRKIGKGE